ncbi:tyrosine-type recombinase/integrase [Streptomyces sp. CA-111067]|uniref:tyrosine-type recombinase/integrase n=1 Tax=Streptomyces sp. CA-111067 TaxID=3240046 RepID=UPI003D992C50
MRTTDVRVFGIQHDERRKKPSFRLRWKVAGKPFSYTARTKGLAEAYQGKLRQAMRDGEEFDTATGLPPSLEEKAADVSWYEFALTYLALRWPHVSPNYRDEINEGLTEATKALLRDTPGRPSDAALQHALREWAFVLPGPGERELPPEVVRVLGWVAKASRPLAEVKEPVVVREVLDSFKLRLDGKAAAGATARRKRKTFVAALNYAVDRGDFAENPVHGVKWEKPKVATEVDPRVVANPAQAVSLLTAVSYVGGYHRARGRRLVGLFGAMYYAGLRPAEAIGLSEDDCTLPARGWGSATLHRTRPTAGKRWTDTGEVHDDRGLKNRAAEDTRVVPLPPRLVVILKESIRTHGVAEDGRLFFNERRGVLGSSTYDRVWHEAREFGLPPRLVRSPLAHRPYDLRHSALSTWLNAGVDPTEVAERAGNSVEVLLARYAKCLYGRREIANQRIEALLDEYN